MEPRKQGSRPRTQKNPRPRTAFSRTDPLEAKDRNAQSQGQGPKTQPQVFSVDTAEPPAARGFGGLGAKPQPLGDFLKFFGKNSYFNAIESHFARVQSHLKALNFEI